MPDNDPSGAPGLPIYETKEKPALTGRSEEFRAFALDRSLRLHQSAYLLCGDWHLAHDLVQDTLVNVYRHWSRVRQADSPDAYVRRILINEARERNFAVAVGLFLRFWLVLPLVRNFRVRGAVVTLAGQDDGEAFLVDRLTYQGLL